MTEGIVTPIASSPSSTARGSGGRTIGYGEFGDPNGKPVVLFHGFGDSRLTRYPDDELTARLGIRLITFDRPGIGLTDPMKELTILDRTDDVIDLVNSLGLQNVSLLGWSGGAPYALAAAGCMAGKVKRVAIVSGFGPFERPGFKKLAPREIKRVMTILKVAPWMANVMATESQKGLQGDATAAMEMSRGIGGSADSGVLNMSGVRANVTSGAEEAFRQGPAGVANDMLLLFRFKWGFNPEDVHTPIDLWYGNDDHMTPPDVGRGLASILPQPRLRMVPGAGHLLYLRNWEEILRTLVADEAPATTTTFQAIAPVAPLSPVTETLAAASLSETTPVAEPDHAEPAAEPVMAQSDVLGSTPAWSWTQPAAATQPAVEAPTETPAEREVAAYQEEAVAPGDTPVFTPSPHMASASGDQLARLRALGFIVEIPEPVVVNLEVVELEAAATPVSESEAAERGVAEPEAGAEAVEPDAGAAEPTLALVDTAPAAEAAPVEPEAARPELKLVEPEAAPKRPALTWEPVRVPGLIIGKPRRIVPVEPAAPAAESIAETTPEPGGAEVVAEAATVEHEAALAEPEAAAVEPESVTEPEAEAVTAEPQGTDAVTAEPEGADAEPAAAPVEAEAQSAGEPEPAVEAAHAQTAIPAIDSVEAERLRAAGFLVSEPEVAAQAPEPEVAPVEDAEARRVRLADDELARLRAAGFAPAEPEHEAALTDVSREPEIAAVEAQAVEPEAIEPEAVGATVVEPEAAEAEPATTESELVVAEAETFTAEDAAAPIEEEPLAEAEPAAVETEPIGEEAEPEPIVAETEAVTAEVEPAPIEDEPAAEAETPVAEAEPAVAAAEPAVVETEAEPAAFPDHDATAAHEEPGPVLTELEEEASEAVVLPAPAYDAGERVAGTVFATPQSEPAPAIAASAADAPIMKAATRTQPPAEVGDEHLVETGVGWVESVPMEVQAAVDATSAHQSEQDSPPEPMLAEAEDEPVAQAPVRDETLERLRAAGYLIGEPRGR